MAKPNFQPALWLAIRVWAHQLVRSSGPSTERMKSLMALIWSSQLITLAFSEAPCAAVLKASVMSGLSCRPALDVTLPSRSAYQRRVSSSRALIWSTRFFSLSRSRKAGCRRAASLSDWARPHRMAENFTVAMVMRVPPACPWYLSHCETAVRRHGTLPALLLPLQGEKVGMWGRFHKPASH